MENSVSEAEMTMDDVIRLKREAEKIGKTAIGATNSPNYQVRFHDFKWSTVDKIIGQKGQFNLFKENKWLEQQPILYDFACPQFAFKVFLLWEKIDESQFNADFYRKMDRDCAEHPDIKHCYAFPYVFVKYNPRFLNPVFEGDLEGDNFRRIIQIQRLDNSFEVEEPLSSENEADASKILEWDGKRFKFVLSKRIFELRDQLVVERKFIEEFLTAEIEPRFLFDKIKGLFTAKNGFVDLEDHWAMLSALWVMGTYVFHLFPAYPYLWLFASGGFGKSRYLKTVAYASHNGEFLQGPTVAVVNRLLDISRGTLCVDEVDKGSEEQREQLLGTWNSGYEDGPTAPRYNMEQSKIERFHIFSPKAFASNANIDHTLKTRCIRIPIMVTGDKEIAGREPAAERNGIFADLRKELTVWSIDGIPSLVDTDWNHIIRKYEAREEFKDATPRLMQILRPLLVLYDRLGLDEEYGTMKSERENLAKAVKIIVMDKSVSTIATMDQKVLVALYRVAKSAETKIDSKCVKEMMVQLDPDLDDTDEKGVKLIAKVGMLLDKYYAEHKRKVNGKTEWLYDAATTPERTKLVTDILDRMKIEYEVNVK